MNRTILPVLLACAFAAGAVRAEDPDPKKRPDQPITAAKPAAKPAAARRGPSKDAPIDAAKANDGAPGDVAPGDGKPKEDPNLGMSILGNQEAPKSLVIVPWKSSEIGRSVDLSTLLDDSRQPIDKDVFMRVLSYYELRSDTTRRNGAAAAAPHGRKP